MLTVATRDLPLETLPAVATVSMSAFHGGIRKIPTAVLGRS